MNQFDICLVEYESAEEIVTQYLQDEFSISFKEKRSKKIMLPALVWDKEYSITMKETTPNKFIKQIEKHGMWAFTQHFEDPNYKEIHYWVGENINRTKLLQGFGHEFAHVAGFSDEKEAWEIGRVVEFTNQVIEMKFGDIKNVS